ncbi:hypothetical protein BGZ82_011614 [Podila clonocystis]|nr:hypothetical protein BGZ82_011614 [Podila clonocystis]
MEGLLGGLVKDKDPRAEIVRAELDAMAREAEMTGLKLRRSKAYEEINHPAHKMEQMELDRGLQDQDQSRLYLHPLRHRPLCHQYALNHRKFCSNCSQHPCSQHPTHSSKGHRTQNLNLVLTQVLVKSNQDLDTSLARFQDPHPMVHSVSHRNLLSRIARHPPTIPMT